MPKISLPDSILESLDLRFGQELNGDVPIPEAMEALKNFIRNNAQNDTIPFARRAVQDTIDQLGFQRLQQMLADNPGAARLLLAESDGKIATSGAAIDPDDLMSTLGIQPGNFDQLRDLGAAYDTSARRSADSSMNMDYQDYTPEEAEAIQQILDSMRSKLTSRTFGQEFADLMEAPGVTKKNNPAMQIDSTLAALAHNNYQRLDGPRPAGQFGDDFDRDIVDELSQGEAPLAQDDLVEAIAMLQQAGVDEETILVQILGALARSQDNLGLDDSLAEGFSPAALMREAETPRALDFTTGPAGEGQTGVGNRVDPDLLKRMLGI